MTDMQNLTQNVLGFWFGTPPANETREMWFKGGPQVDADIRDRFLDIYRLVRDGGADSDAETAEDFLARILVLDQFPRNMFRGTPEAFATDPLAKSWAERAVALGHDQALPAPHMRIFIYLPFEHSEALADQDRCVQLCERMGNDNYTAYARAHRDVIARFGRFPHRNAFLGRTSTPDEEAYLQQPGAGF